MSIYRKFLTHIPYTYIHTYIHTYRYLSYLVRLYGYTIMEIAHTTFWRTRNILLQYIVCATCTFRNLEISYAVNHSETRSFTQSPINYVMNLWTFSVYLPFIAPAGVIRTRPNIWYDNCLGHRLCACSRMRKHKWTNCGTNIFIYVRYISCKVRCCNLCESTFLTLTARYNAECSTKFYFNQRL